MGKKTNTSFCSFLKYASATCTIDICFGSKQTSSLLVSFKMTWYDYDIRIADKFPSVSTYIVDPCHLWRWETRWVRTALQDCWSFDWWDASRFRVPNFSWISRKPKCSIESIAAAKSISAAERIYVKKSIADFLKFLLNVNIDLVTVVESKYLYIALSAQTLGAQICPWRHYCLST